MDLNKLYEKNADFQRYVDRYRKKDGISVEEALQHQLIKNYAEYMLEKEQNNVQPAN